MPSGKRWIKGIQIIPSTGRSEDMQPPQIEADERIHYYITSAGTRVVDHNTGEDHTSGDPVTRRRSGNVPGI